MNGRWQIASLVRRRIWNAVCLERFAYLGFEILE